MLIMEEKFLHNHFLKYEYLSIKLERALSNNANLFLTKTNLEPVVFVAKSKSSIPKIFS